MSDYIIDITIENIPEHEYGNPGMITLYIKIDKNGNVDIKRKIVSFNNMTHGPSSFITIIDNIPIPSYIINSIKNSLCKRGYKTTLPGINTTCLDLFNYHHYLNAIENIIILKKELAKCQSTLVDLL
jgi:hypothetical protein